jgi:hypothetical protein
MANQPFEGLSGPLTRLKLNEPYPSVDPAADASDGDIIARKLSGGDDEIEDTTVFESLEEEVEKRSMEIATILTRAGIYHMLESRLNA